MIKRTISKILIVLYFLFTGISVNAQHNLVPNNSFEVYTLCPTLYTPPPPPWFIPTNRHHLYANSCAISMAFGVPNNYFGGMTFQYARTGDAYISISLYDEGVNSIPRTYTEVKLKDSLRAGKCYYVGYHINLGDDCSRATNNAGLLFTNNAVYVDTVATPYGVLPANPQITNYGNPVIKDKINWVKVSGVYVAEGGEKYITLGNFKTDAQTKIDTLTTGNYNWGVYLIDDVFVIPLDSMPLKADAGLDTSIANVGDSVFIGSLTNGITNITWYNSSGAIINTQAPGFYVKPSSSTFYVVEQTVCGFTSRDTVNVNVGTVPLKFTMYDVRFTNENQSTSLQGVASNEAKQSVENIWQTANEINVSHFNIQRSINGKDFVNIGSVKAGGVSSYSFLDNKLPITQDLFTIYYRIESIDFDDKKQYTETKRVKLNEQLETRNVVLYPNPAKDIVNIECKDGIKEIKLFNAMGKQIATGTNLRNDGNLKLQTLNLQQVSKGLYLVKVVSKTGAVYNNKLVIE